MIEHRPTPNRTRLSSGVSTDREVTPMKRFLTLGTIALIALTLGISADASPRSAASLQHKVEWQAQRIRRLEHRRDYLHRYIRHLRKRISHTSTSYSGGVLSASQVASYARGAGFPESVIPEMVYIASRESGFDPGAINPTSGACGLWQIYPAQPGCTSPSANAAMAYAKYQAAGLQPWALTA